MRWRKNPRRPDPIRAHTPGHSGEKWRPSRFGTDYPIEVISPLPRLYACVTRQLPDGTPAGAGSHKKKISLQDCISAYTSRAAYAEFEEGKKGELKVGGTPTL